MHQSEFNIQHLNQIVLTLVGFLVRQNLTFLNVKILVNVKLWCIYLYYIVLYIKLIEA